MTDKSKPDTPEKSESEADTQATQSTQVGALSKGSKGEAEAGAVVEVETEVAEVAVNDTPAPTTPDQAEPNPADPGDPAAAHPAHQDADPAAAHPDDDPGAAHGKKPPKNLIDAIIKGLRPKQWVKNVLVLAAPISAGADTLFDASTLLDVAIAFVAFCLAASSIYLINDARDIEADRAHPTKRFRPIASGMLPQKLAYVLAVVLIIAAVAVSYVASSGHGLVIVMVVYIVLQLGYCFGWKHQPVIDIALVSSGFMLRAMAGGVAAGIYLSQWFLLVAAFGSLFMAAGKRYAEIILAQESGAKIRKSLEGYTVTYLRFVWTLAATSVVIAYALWGFEMARQSAGTAAVWYQVSMVPFTVAILRYAADVDRGAGGAPDELALTDRTLQILAVVWLACIGVAVYVVPALGLG